LLALVRCYVNDLSESWSGSGSPQKWHQAEY